MPTEKLHHPAPSGLGDAGRDLWAAHASKYEFRPDELAFLRGACRAADMIAKIAAAWADEGEPMYAKGSMGQLVEHPAPKGIRSWEAQQAALLARLKLPDDESVDAAVNQQRDAANSKWATGRGRGA